MAANKVPLAAAATNTQMDDTVLNPVSTGTSRRIYHITLVTEGIALDPQDVYDALDAEWAVVAGEKNYMSRGTWIFNIGPA